MSQGNTNPNLGAASAAATAAPPNPPLDEHHRALYAQGLEVRRAVVGPAYVDRALSSGSSDFARAGQELVTSQCWGSVWTRPGLDRRQRSLLNIGILMALNRGPELAVHVRGARRNGLSELEIREAIVHATAYCGAPAGMDAFRVAERALDELAESGEVERELGGKSRARNEEEKEEQEKAARAREEQAGRG